MWMQLVYLGALLLVATMPGSHCTDSAEAGAHEARYRRANSNSDDKKDESFNNHVMYYSVAASIGFVLLVVILSALICCCVIHKNMANRRKVAPAKSGPYRANQNWQMLRGKMGQGQLRKSNPRFQNNRDQSQWGGDSNQGLQNGGHMVWSGGTNQKWPNSNMSQAQLSGYSQKPSWQSQNSKMAHLNSQLQEEPGAAAPSGNANERRASQSHSLSRATPSHVVLNDKPKQPPNWHVPNGGKQAPWGGIQNRNAATDDAHNSSMPPPNGPQNSGWQPTNGDPHQTHLNENSGYGWQGSNQNYSNRNHSYGNYQGNPENREQKPGWKKIIFDL